MDEIVDTVKSIERRDPELSGQLNRALVKGHDFSYYLSLLSPSLLDRVHINDYDDGRVKAEETLEHPYRNAPLCATEAVWQLMQHNSEIIATQDTNQLRLWQCMHPDPLAIHNDPTLIEPEVTANCEWGVQQRIAEKLINALDAQPALLLDTLESSHTTLI